MTKFLSLAVWSISRGNRIIKKLSYDHRSSLFYATCFGIKFFVCWFMMESKAETRHLIIIYRADIRSYASAALHFISLIIFTQLTSHVILVSISEYRHKEMRGLSEDVNLVLWLITLHMTTKEIMNVELLTLLTAKSVPQHLIQFLCKS